MNTVISIVISDMLILVAIGGMCIYRQKLITKKLLCGADKESYKLFWGPLHVLRYNNEINRWTGITILFSFVFIMSFSLTIMEIHHINEGLQQIPYWYGCFN